MQQQVYVACYFNNSADGTWEVAPGVFGILRKTPNYTVYLDSISGSYPCAHGNDEATNMWPMTVSGDVALRLLRAAT